MEKITRNTEVHTLQQPEIRKTWQTPTVEELEVKQTEITTGGGDDGIGGTS